MFNDDELDNDSQMKVTPVSKPHQKQINTDLKALLQKFQPKKTNILMQKSSTETG